jgi:hypothetical protein
MAKRILKLLPLVIFFVVMMLMSFKGHLWAQMTQARYNIWDGPVWNGCDGYHFRNLCSGNTMMIPHRTSTEWSTAVNNSPACLGKSYVYGCGDGDGSY